MSDRVKEYLDRVFAPYAGVKAVSELKGELCRDLQEKVDDLKAEGYDEDTACEKALDSLGDISEVARSIAAEAKEPQPQAGLDLSMSDLKHSDLREVTARNHKFNCSALTDSDFTRSDLTGASFKCADLTNVRFEGANLTGAKLVMSSLKGASFQDAVLDGTDFSYSSLAGANFDGQRLRGTIFNNCGLNGTSFRNAVLENVSFKTDARKAIFAGAVMDKLTYALLKSAKADLGGVTVV